MDTWTAWGRTKDSERLSRLLLPRLITLLFLESAAKLRLSEERDPLEPEQPPSSRWPLGVRVQILGSGERDSLHQELSSSSQDISKATSASASQVTSGGGPRTRLTGQLDGVVLLTLVEVGGGAVVVGVGAVGVPLVVRESVYK